MDYYSDINAYKSEKRSVVTLGKFDGLHRGHQKLIERVREYASDEIESIVCAFEMNSVVLLTCQEKQEMLCDKVDHLICTPFTREIRQMSAEDFIEKILIHQFHAAYVVVGSDFRFGYQAQGNTALLEKLQDKYGYHVDVIPKEMYEGREISSTYVKEALAEGNVKLAEELLGFPYSMTGHVEHGKQLGRTLGFPTMNVSPRDGKILPKFGVYACRVLMDGQYYYGVGNVGIKPTVTDEEHLLTEVYVYDYQGNAYDKLIRIEFCDFERPECKFHGLDELQAQVMKDMAYGKEFFKNGTLHNQ